MFAQEVPIKSSAAIYIITEATLSTKAKALLFLDLKDQGYDCRLMIKGEDMKFINALKT